MAKRLGNKLWLLIEGPEGYAFISDDVVDMSDRKVMDIAKASLAGFEQCVEILERFIEDNG